MVSSVEGGGKEHIFLLKSRRVADSSCHILKVWDGEELVFDTAK
jgi:hypothetical protein